MTFIGGEGSIMLQNFTLADGQICVRAVFSWADDAETTNFSIYPRENFDWLAAADQIASGWMTGRPVPAASSPSHAEPVSSTGSAVEAAAG